MSHDLSRIDQQSYRNVLLGIAAHRYFRRQDELGALYGFTPLLDELLQARSGAWSAIMGEARVVEMLTSPENPRPYTTHEAIQREVQAAHADARAHIASWG